MTVYVYAHTATGGHLRYTRELADGLANLDVPTVLVTGASGVQTTAAREMNVPSPDVTARGIQRVANRIGTYLRQHLFLRRYVRSAHIGPNDVFHFQELPSLFPGLAVTTIGRSGARTALTVHNVRPHAGHSLAAGLVSRLHRRQWRRLDVLIVHSPSLRDDLLTQHPEISPDHVVVIPHPIWHEPEDVLVEAAKDYVLFGALRRNKGIETFIDALAALDDPVATIAGATSEDYEAELRDRVIARGLTNCDLRVGFVEDPAIPPLLSSHRVVVLPYTQFAAQSGVVNQAVACDRPVVVTDVGALGDLVREFGVGEIAASMSVADLAHAMTTCRVKAVHGDYGANLANLRDLRSITVIAREHHHAYLGASHD